MTVRRTPLGQTQILIATLTYIDTNGLATLNMHKLGTKLEIKNMSLYNHVANKNDILNKIIETL